MYLHGPVLHLVILFFGVIREITSLDTLQAVLMEILRKEHIQKIIQFNYLQLDMTER